jgi:hypothetical protein
VIRYAKNPWRQASALAPLAHGVVDVATHEGPAIALANKIARWRVMMAKGERYKEPETPSSQLLSG